MIEKAMISLSFDDGRSDNVAVLQNILIPRELPATFNITTGYVDGSFDPGDKFGRKQALCVQDVVAMSKIDFVEIAMHGDKHLNTVEDMAVCAEKLCSWRNSEQEYFFCGIASPHSELDVSSAKELKRGLIQLGVNISYIRISENKTDSVFEKILRKVYARTRNSKIYAWSRCNSLMKTCDDVVYSVPVTRDRTIEEIKSLIDLCIQKRSALTLMFHSIVPDVSKEDMWSWDTSQFEKICDYLKAMQLEGKLLVCKTREIYEKLTMER